MNKILINRTNQLKIVDTGSHKKIYTYFWFFCYKLKKYLYLKKSPGMV